MTALAIWGALIIGAVYMLRAVRAALHGPMPEKWAGVADANLWRKLPYALLLASLLVFGFFPSLLTDKIKLVTEQIVKMAAAKAAAPAIVATDNAGSRGRESAPSDSLESERRLTSAVTEPK